MNTNELTGCNRVRLLCAYANLPLESEREQAIADILDVWIADASQLSLKMSQPAHQDLSPVTVFAHPSGYSEDS